MVLTILKNISQWEGLSHILWEKKHVWNHQPDIYCYIYPFGDAVFSWAIGISHVHADMADAGWCKLVIHSQHSFQHCNKPPSILQPENHAVQCCIYIYMCVCVRVCVHLYLYTFIYMIISNYYGFTLLLDIYIYIYTFHNHSLFTYYSQEQHRAPRPFFCPQGRAKRRSPPWRPANFSIYLSIHPSIHPGPSIYLSLSIWKCGCSMMLPNTKLRRFTLRAPAVPQRPRVPRLVARDSAAEVQDLPRQEPVQQRNGLLALARFDFSEGQRKDLFRAKYGRFPYRNSSRKKPPEGKKIHRSNCRSSCGQLRRTLLIGWLEIEHGPYPSVHQAWWHGPLNRT